MPIRDILDKLEHDEQRFVGQQFLAPIVGAARVTVRIAGIVCQIAVVRALAQGFSGWAILRSLSTSTAEFVRAANLAETAQYLALLPAVKLVLVHRDSRQWYALPAQRGDTRFRIAGPVAVQLTEDGLELFETVRARFDGRLFWHEQRDPGRDPSLAAYLRAQLAQPAADGLPPQPESLHAHGLSREERDAYEFARALLAEAQRDRVQVRLSEALTHAGGELRSYFERPDAYVVRYAVDGVQHVTTIRRDDLTVMTAGICLSGEDQRFDLASLVGVLREAESEGSAQRVGGWGIPDEEYRRMYPPRE